MKKRIAYCLSGQIRGIAQAAEYVHKNLLDDPNLEVKVFAHAWTKGTLASTEDEIYTQYMDSIGKVKVEYPALDEQAINSYYTRTPDASKWPPYNTASAFLSMKRSHDLLTEYVNQGNPRFDIVIRSRYDYALNRQLDFTHVAEEARYGIIMIPNCRMVPSHDFGNDQFAYSTPELMIAYMSTWDRLRYFYDHGVEMIGENMMSANLKAHGLKVDYVDMNNPFPPGPHNGSWHSLVRDDIDQWK